jgi:TatD DNase family protein
MMPEDAQATPSGDARSEPEPSGRQPSPQATPSGDARSEPEASGRQPRWIDSHAHVTAREFDGDRDEALARAFAGGVDALIAIGAGYGVEANALAVELAGRDARVWAAVGVHPHDAATLDDAGRALLQAWLAAPRVVAVGECGLDYFYMHSPRDVQQRAFAEQLGLARARLLPVVIHVRSEDESAYEDVLAIWQAEGGGALRGVLHCYTGSLAFAKRALDHGLEVSFSGILTFKKDRGLREVARALPLERLLVETDAPLLAPEGQRGRRNEPAWVAKVGEVLAAVQGRAVEEVAAVTSANARRLFGLSERPGGRGAA